MPPRFSYTNTPLQSTELRLSDAPPPVGVTAVFGVFDRDHGRYVAICGSRAEAQAIARASNALAGQKVAA